MNPYKPLVVAVDFDGTCVTHTDSVAKIGDDIGAAPVLQDIVMRGARIILTTVRTGKPLEDAIEWFTKNRLPLYGVNHNPDQSEWTDSKKIYAHLYIDILAIGAPAAKTEGAFRPHIDWQQVAGFLSLNVAGLTPASQPWLWSVLEVHHDPLEAAGVEPSLLGLNRALEPIGIHAESMKWSGKSANVLIQSPHFGGSQSKDEARRIKLYFSVAKNGLLLLEGWKTPDDLQWKN